YDRGPSSVNKENRADCAANGSTKPKSIWLGKGFHEMYERLGPADFGRLFSCSRDFAFVGGFNRKLKLKRTQTIMEGDRFCDFQVVRAKQRSG
ncbi:MAG: hypothetical protein FJ388_21860, partial [Verrucomicrobia bacterium]|nr:hypothetical protein [Verrucomicrobiota bacterium]